jgi:hypothetical protein
MVDGDWQHRHFRPDAAGTTQRRSRAGLVATAIIGLLLGLAGLGVCEWLGYTGFGLRAWIVGLFSAPPAEQSAPEEALPTTAAPAAAPPGDGGTRLRQLAGLIAQQERGIDLMQRELAETTRGEEAARRDADAAATRVASGESYLANARLTARQAADARSALSAATADLNNARRRAKELGEKRQSLTARIAKAGATRDEARRESERLAASGPGGAPQ